jgi:retinol dehydrogenase-12
VIFVSSSAHRASVLPDGINWNDIHLRNASGLKGEILKYGQSKAMNVMHCHEFARIFHKQGLVSFSVHPGALTTGLQTNLPTWFNAIFGLLRKPPYFGALTELFAGLGELRDGDERMLVEGGRNGGYIVPWGRFGDGSGAVFEGLANRATGERLWRLCEKELKDYL